MYVNLRDLKGALLLHMPAALRNVDRHYKNAARGGAHRCNVKSSCPLHLDYAKMYFYCLLKNGATLTQKLYLLMLKMILNKYLWMKGVEMCSVWGVTNRGKEDKYSPL